VVFSLELLAYGFRGLWVLAEVYVAADAHLAGQESWANRPECFSLLWVVAWPILLSDCAPDPQSLAAGRDCPCVVERRLPGICDYTPVGEMTIMCFASHRVVAGDDDVIQRFGASSGLITRKIISER